VADPLQTILLAYQQLAELSFYNLTSMIWAAQRIGLLARAPGGAGIGRFLGSHVSR
jgi:hypothetical protein